MTRGDLVVVSLPGDYGKPRPAIIIQGRQFESHPSIALLRITSHLIDAPLLRVDIGPGSGLDRRSQIHMAKPHTMLRERIGPVIGRADEPTIRRVDRLLALLLGLA
jgi:mRNA interferase MazF